MEHWSRYEAVGWHHLRLHGTPLSHFIDSYEGKLLQTLSHSSFLVGSHALLVFQASSLWALSSLSSGLHPTAGDHPHSLPHLRNASSLLFTGPELWFSSLPPPLL
jgi:hypothetical protein